MNEGARERVIKRKPILVIFWLLLGTELCALLDLSLTCNHITLHGRQFLLLCGLIFLLTGLLSRQVQRFAAVAVSSVTAVMLLGLAGYAVAAGQFSRNAGYADLSPARDMLFGGEKVLLIVPHEDDDLNVLGGVIEEYLDADSEFYVLFMTNGDFYALGETRMREALDLYRCLGVPDDHVLFLGYSERLLNEDGVYLYQAGDEDLLHTLDGVYATYGLPEHPAFRDGRTFTKQNLLEDLYRVLNSVRPSVIFCCDYDEHVDHKACSLLFEQAMGKLLKADQTYRPTVYKGYAYGTAWNAEPDFYQANVLETKNPFLTESPTFPAVYRWEDRVRFPVAVSSLSASILSSSLYRQLQIYDSQDAILRASRVINSDKVFWERRTDSLCLTAEIRATSSDASRLNDFMLLDSKNLSDPLYYPEDGVWSPAEDDSEKTVTFSLQERSQLDCIVLYDNPSPESNLLKLAIRFDDGEEILAGPLDPNGAATLVQVEKENVTAFEITILDAEGEHPGLSEVEAFSKPDDRAPKLLKMTNLAGNFIYDYEIDKSGEERFSVYPEWMGEASPEVTCDNPRCEAYWEDGKILVRCPIGEACILTVYDREHDLSDCVLIRNRRAISRGCISAFQELEQFRLEGYKNSHVLRLVDAVRYSPRLRSA